MAEKQHALLSASSSHRWLTVPPLARLEEFFEHKTNPAAEEGTLAHALAEYKLKSALRIEAEEPEGELTLEMEQATEDYVAFILDELEQLKQGTSDPMFQKVLELLTASLWQTALFMSLTLSMAKGCLLKRRTTHR